MTTCLEAIRAYFEEKNRTWITADMDGLAAAAQVKSGSAWLRAVSGGVRAKQRAMQARRSKLLRAHSRVHVRRLEESTDSAVHALMEEHITWVYRDGPDFGVESRIVQHRQRWHRHGARWTLEKAWESDESQPGMVELPAPEQVADVRKPVPEQGVIGGTRGYDRVRALRFAELWWNGWNPAFPRLADDCTNFVSQCLWAGGIPMQGGVSRAAGWWYKVDQPATAEPWSYSWTTANALYLFLIHKAGAQVLKSARELRIGDLVFYDWNGTGKFHHSTIVTDFDHHGDPLVNAHTDASYHRHYLYLDSRAWTQNTRYAYVHLPDTPT